MRQKTLFHEVDVPDVPAQNLTFLERYHAGERKKVWRELVRLGPDVYHERFHTNALAVARETMKRALHNLGLIHARLIDLGYQFDEPELAFAPAIWDSKIDIAIAQREIEYLPLSMQATASASVWNLSW